ncbi:MAG: YgiT-type zinc finger protein [Deltaproteobacteria bacterium]|nr:MAG: YgiT-type zinc finger protein [Deltaproteobacteria bacterium]
MTTQHNICLNCGHKLVTKRENHPYRSLPGTVLVGVPVHRCPNCGESEVEIPMIDDLNRTLAGGLIVKTSRLIGVEIRFLRGWLDYSSAEFARLLGSSPVTVSRWEHDAQLAGVSIESFKTLGPALAGAKPRRGKRNRLPVLAVRPLTRRWERTALKAA